MKNQPTKFGIACALTALSLVACSKNTPPAAEPPADTTSPAPVQAEPAPAPLAEPEEELDQVYVEGVAGGVMTHTLTLEAEVVAVDQAKKEAVLRGPDGGHVVVRVGKDAVNFYQVAVGDRVKVAMMQELVVYVDDAAQSEPDSTAAAAAGAEKGATPAGMVVATTKITSKITAMDTKARTATLTFEDKTKKTFEVRPDVDMTKYKVGQSVVFLVTEMLALKVEKI